MLGLLLGMEKELMVKIYVAVVGCDKWPGYLARSLCGKRLR